MTAKEFLNRGYLIDQRIDSKLKIIAGLREMATNISATRDDMPASPNRNIDKVEKIIVKIVDLENEINAEIDELVDTKAAILHSIEQVEDVECRALLEYRYVDFYTWEMIADYLGCSVRKVHLLHSKALQMVKIQEDI